MFPSTEVIKDVVFLVGALQVFQSMYEHIVSRQGVTGSTWDEAEAALFVMSAVAKSLHPQQESVVPLVLQSILQLPDATHVAVRVIIEHRISFITNREIPLRFVDDFLPAPTLPLSGVAHIYCFGGRVIGLDRRASRFPGARSSVLTQASSTSKSDQARRRSSRGAAENMHHMLRSHGQSFSRYQSCRSFIDMRKGLNGDPFSPHITYD